MNDDASSLGKRVQRVEGSIGDITRRLDLIQQGEAYQKQMQEERDRNLRESLKRLEDKIDGANEERKDRASKDEAFKRQMIIAVFIAVLGVVITFWTKGGFTNVPGA